MMMRFFLLLSVSLIFSACSGQTKDLNKDYYNLSFSENRKYNQFFWHFESLVNQSTGRLTWRKDAELNRTVCCLDEIGYPDGKRMPLRAMMIQCFPLFEDFNKVNVQVNIKAEKLTEAWLKVEALDILEKCVRKDSVKFENDGWQTYRSSLPLQGVRYLRISLSVWEYEINPGARLMIDSMDVRLDGRSINEESGASATIAPQLDRSSLQPLSFAEDSLIGLIPLFDRSPRIIGLGEMMHGSLSLGMVKNQVIRWLVENKQCKLVMLEVPGILCLKWDLYVQGFSVNLEEIVEDMAGTEVVRREIVELLNFLREYNRKTSRKVHIVGVDRSPENGYMMLIFDYLYALYQRNPENCLYRLVRNNILPDSVYHILIDAEEKLINNMGKFQYAWFRKLYGLKVSEQGFSNGRKHAIMNIRDSIIWLHADYAIRAAELQSDECAVITGHGFHLNKTNLVISSFPSAGYYLAKHYGEDYRALWLLAGAGSFCAFSMEKMLYDSTCTLPIPSKDLLESRAMEIGVPYFYYSVDKLPQIPIRFRYCPLFYEKRKPESLNLLERIDGFIFVRESESEAIPIEHRKIDAYYSDKVFHRRLKRMMECGYKMGIDFDKL